MAFVFLLGLALALFCVGPRRISAATRARVQGQETDDEVKVNLYKKFTDNRVPNPTMAYEVAREYMRRYTKENDDYTRYLKSWIAAYEKDDREQRLLSAIYGKNFAEGYGLAKQVLSDSPDNLKVLIALGYGGYLAANETKNEKFNAESLNYAQKATQLIEAGKAPDAWEPFKNRDDALASLHFAIGFVELKTKPEDAIGRFIKVSQIDSDLKKAPSTYFWLAVAYEKGPYQRLSADYSKRFANQPETPESKAALDNVNKVMDRIIDAYARAVALAGNDPKQQASKAEWTKRLTDLYKFRHDNSDAGLTEFISGVLAKPLPG
jgi:hypothetical protein